MKKSIATTAAIITALAMAGCTQADRAAHVAEWARNRGSSPLSDTRKTPSHKHNGLGFRVV